MLKVSDFQPNQKVKAVKLSPKNEKKFGLEFIVQDNYNQKRYVICKSTKSGEMLRIHPSMLEVIGEVKGDVRTKKRVEHRTQAGKRYNKEVAQQIAVKAMANVLRNGKFYNMVTNYGERKVEHIGYDKSYFYSVVREELSKYTNKPTTLRKMNQTINFTNLLGNVDLFSLYGVVVNEELRYAQYDLEPIEKPSFDFDLESMLDKVTDGSREFFHNDEHTNSVMYKMVGEKMKVLEMLKKELEK